MISDCFGIDFVFACQGELSLKLKMVIMEIGYSKVFNSYVLLERNHPKKIVTRAECLLFMTAAYLLFNLGIFGQNLAFPGVSWSFLEFPMQCLLFYILDFEILRHFQLQ